MLMFGREVRAPADCILNVNDNLEAVEVSTGEYIWQRQQLMTKVYQRVRELLGAAAIQRKDYWDVGVKGAKFAVGQWVWYLYQRRRQGLSPKWQSSYVGPYLAVKVLSDYNIVIQKTKRSTPLVVHKDKLKPSHSSTLIA